MRYFNNDYNEVCHPAILSAFAENASVQMPGYSEDTCCREAAELIRKKCDAPNAAVHFLVGGTQTNLTVIAAALRPHQGVIAAESGHISVHETGAIEATGHKVITLPSKDGKVDPALAKKVVENQSRSVDAEHIVQPKMIYISNPTEYGTLYSLAELQELSALCKEKGLFLFVDGARMGYGLAAKGNDITLADYAEYSDAFYIGGTKVGAMFGEAVVIPNPAIAEDFRYLMKQRGGMLAKGWLLGLQFKTLFENDLYFAISAHADQMADKLRKALTDLGYALYLPGTTNQVFVTLPDKLLNELGEEFTFAVWEKPDEKHTTVRFCTSWATTDENVDALCAALKNLSKC
ncbi:MAG: aminotransferase class I/II-fold pyridoxal phosphate-dependent enzyme [Oscillospiraceae bacterium]|nr:aminotransferase class I/II-fold pyridoxal phosphate-dependent enzyme [Oscillospiraceae bacterium]